MFTKANYLLFSLTRKLPHVQKTLVAALLLIALAKNAPAQRVWVEQGPGPNTQGQVEGIPQRPVVGAINSVATHPTDAATIFVGAVNGGIWKTTNATAATPTWVEQLGVNRALSIGAIAFDPTDGTNQTLIAGVGRFSSFLSRGSDRVGVWRTTDGGTSWTLISGAGGTVTGLNITGVAPRGATLVVSANAADSFANRGVWRSTNTGGAWTQISGAAGTGLPAGISFDLAGDPANNAILFTNSGGSGIYRSLDTGATWTKVSDAAMDAVMAGGTNNVKISIGASNNVYVAIVGGSNRLAGLFRSGDGGNNWTALDLPTTIEAGNPVGIHPGGQGWVHISLAADSTNPNVVYIGGDRQPTPFPNSIGAVDFSGRLFRVDASQPVGSQSAHITHSNTSGATSPHADSRDMAMDVSGNLIETNDGGIYRRSTPLVNTGNWSSLIGNLRTTEFHSASWDSNSKIAAGGAQDTGSPHGTIPGSFLWLSVSTADGGDSAINDTGTPGTSVRYSSNQFLGGFRRRTYDTSNTFLTQVLPALTLVGGGATLVRQFYTPVEVNNVTPTRLVIGGSNSVYESTDQGDTIREIGPGIVANGTGPHPLAYGATGNADMLYVGSGDRVFVRSAAPPAALTQAATYPGTGTARQVSGVTINNTDPQNAFVVDATNVYRTGDGGGSWTNVTGNLLTLTPGTIRSVAFSTADAAGSVIVGSDNGVYFAPGPAFDTWAVLGTGLPRAPAYDLEYDAKDKILIAGLLGRGAWTINLEDRTPVDVAMVLDLSGSMLSPACPTCSPKLDVLKDAVELFVQLWTLFTVPNDRIGTNYFRTNVNEFTIGPDVLLPVSANAPAIIADVRSQTTVPANLTAMGGGIQTAINRLTDTTRPRNIIVFTDGMQNVNPMVNTSTFEIANQPGRPASGVSATVPPTDLNTALGIKVNTIGVGATPPFVDLLSQIAMETNGRFKLTTAPDEDLRRFYIEELIDVLRQFSPQLVGYRYGTTAGATGSETFTTNQTARRVVLKLSWKRGAALSFTVEKDGVDVTSFGRIVEGQFYRIFTIDVPRAGGPAITAAGNWTMNITGSVPTQYEAAAIVEEQDLKYEFNMGSARLVGDPLPLQVKVSFDGLPVTDANVTAQVLTPKQALSNLLSTRATPAAPAGFQYELAATDAQRKFQLLLGDTSFRDALRPSQQPIVFQHNGNGTYSATFGNTSVSGPYTVIYRVAGQRADIGAYSRTESQTVALTFGHPSGRASLLSKLSDRTGAGRYDLIVRPVDRLNNYLGPDYGHAIAVSVNGVPVTSVPQDRLDGSYVFPIVTTTSPALTNINITVLGRPLFSGPLSTIPTPGQASRFAFSFHTGVAIPVKGFGSAASAGLLTEFDFEYRATPKFSLEGVLGRYDFGAPAEIYSGSLLFKGYFPAGSGRFYVSGGPGAFHITGGSTHFGLNGGAGFNQPVNSWLELEFGASYSHLFRSNLSDLGFVGIRGGVKFKF